MKKNHYITLMILTLLVISITIFVALNSFALSIRHAGYSSKDIEYLESDFDGNGNGLKIIKTSSDTEEIVLVVMEKSSFGIWKIAYSSEKLMNGCNSIGWMKPAGVKRFDIDENPVFETEWHILYYGNNATKLISIEPEQFPLGVAVNIKQAGELYSIHLVLYGNGDDLNKIDMQAILLDGNFIE